MHRIGNARYGLDGNKWLKCVHVNVYGARMSIFNATKQTVPIVSGKSMCKYNYPGDIAIVKQMTVLAILNTICDAPEQQHSQ